MLIWLIGSFTARNPKAAIIITRIQMVVETTLNAVVMIKEALIARRLTTQNQLV